MLPQSNVQVFMPTSIAPWHPNPEVTMATISDVREVLQTNAKINIYCDGAHPKALPEEVANYREYIEGLHSIDNVEIVCAHRWAGLLGLFRMFISDIDKPLVMNVQHDWEFVEPKRIDIEPLCQLMMDDAGVQIVRFHKRPLPQRPIHVDREYYETNKYPIPLIRTNGWGDSPHVARADHYHTFVHAFMAQHSSDDGRYGVEGPLWKAYQKDIHHQGFDVAQNRWGSFLYGRFNEEGLVKHRGSEARKWRNERGMDRKCLNAK